MSNEDKELYEKQYEGLEIKCKKCGNIKINVRNTVGFSDLSGAWGGVSLVCVDCGNEVDLFEA